MARRSASVPGFMLRFVTVAAVIGVATCGVVIYAGTPLQPTLETHAGPWYEPGAPFARRLWQKGQPGQSLQLRGRVLNTTGAPVAEALVELWHTDALGQYPPLRASLKTNAKGAFGIATLMPGHHMGYRARHIHFVISHPGHRRLVTRIFFKGDINIDEAPFPELAVFLEQSEIAGESRYFAEVEFVLQQE